MLSVKSSSKPFWALSGARCALEPKTISREDRDGRALSCWVLHPWNNLFGTSYAKATRGLAWTCIEPPIVIGVSTLEASILCSTLTEWPFSIISQLGITQFSVGKELFEVPFAFYVDIRSMLTRAGSVFTTGVHYMMWHNNG